MTIEHADIVVIGAGVSGLGFANWYREKHPTASVVVLEREAEPGGYCRTVVQDGFVWDYSGHFFHFREPAIEAWLRERMPGQDIRTVVKESAIRYAGLDIPFPFQKNIHRLAQDEFVECLVDVYFAARVRDTTTASAPPASFGDMLVQRLGNGITEKFLRPYNEKLYATDLDTLDVDAMGRFFPHANLDDIIANMRPGQRDGGYNATFTYPAGGAMEYIRALLRDLPPASVRCNEPALSIDLTRREVTTPRGVIRYDRIVSSAPIDALARLAAVAHADVFTSNKVLVFNLGFDRKGARGIHWMYFPDRSVCFYRVGWYDNILDGDRMSLYVEVGAPHDAVFDPDALRARVLADLARENIIDGHQLVSHHHVVLDPAYCHITKASLAEHARLHAVFEAASVHSVGRYGRWTYCSIEDNLIETRELAARL